MEDFALFCHLLGAFLFVSGAIVAGVSFEAARRRQAPAEISSLLGLARVGAALLGIGLLLVVAFGLWLVDLGDWGYGAGWIGGAIALLIGSVVLGGFGGQTPKKARILATRLAGEGKPADDELHALLNDRVALVFNYLSILLVVAILVLMVWKPGATGS